ncbi:hypothetical protein ACMAZD_09935 [Vibrio sp. nBUS_14]
MIEVKTVNEIQKTLETERLRTFVESFIADATAEQIAELRKTWSNNDVEF